MKRFKIGLLVSLFFLISGCTDFLMICSLNPFYVDQDITMVHQVVGSWKATPLKPHSEDKKVESGGWNALDTTAVWKIERYFEKERRQTKPGKDTVVFKPTNYYWVRLINQASKTEEFAFKMVLFRVNRALYADFTPVANASLAKSRMASESYVSVHTLARVFYRDKQVKFSWLGADYMKSMIEDKRVRVSYRWISRAQRLVLTGTSQQLTGMIERYSGEPRFIDWDVQKAMLMLNRQK